MKKTGILATVGLALVVMLGSGCDTKETEYVHVGPNWNKIHNLKASDKSFKVTVKGKQAISVGDAMEFTVKSEKDGRLWVIQVDAQDQLDVLFPNDMSPDNQVKAGETYSLPPANSGWAITAVEPLGKSTVAFLVTTNDESLRYIFNDSGMSAQKDMILDKGLTLTAADPEWAVGRMVVDIEQRK